MRHGLPGTVVIATAPERQPSGKSGREGYQRPRPRKLTAEEQTAVRGAARRGCSLRTLARAYRVSHETIRAVLCQPRSDASAAKVGSIMDTRGMRVEPQGPGDDASAFGQTASAKSAIPELPYRTPRLCAGGCQHEPRPDASCAQGGSCDAARANRRDGQ